MTFPDPAAGTLPVEDFRDGALRSVQVCVDNGDGTGTWSTYDPAGNVLSVGAAVPLPEAPEPVVLPLTDEIATARALLLSSGTNTVSLTKQRAAALDVLREQQLLAVLSPET